MPHNKPRITQSDIDMQIEEDWRELTELVVEAMEECVKNGKWKPETGLVGAEDTLNETFLKDEKKKAT